MRCGKHTVCMCYFEGKKNLKYKKTQKPTFNQCGVWPMTLWGGRYLQVPPPCQGALNLCLFTAPPPGSRQFEGQIQSADCRPFHDWLKKKGLFKCMPIQCWEKLTFLYFIFTWSADCLGAIGVGLGYIFFRRKWLCWRNVKNALLGY